MLMPYRNAVHVAAMIAKRTQSLLPVHLAAVGRFHGEHSELQSAEDGTTVMC